jgi:hypothetical protein
MPGVIRISGCGSQRWHTTAGDFDLYGGEENNAIEVHR